MGQCPWSSGEEALGKVQGVQVSAVPGAFGKGSVGKRPLRETSLFINATCVGWLKKFPQEDIQKAYTGNLRGLGLLGEQTPLLGIQPLCSFLNNVLSGSGASPHSAGKSTPAVISPPPPAILSTHLPENWWEECGLTVPYSSPPEA